MSNLDNYNKLIQTIAQLSARAKTKLTGEQYRINIENDEDTLENIADSLFLSLADDLAEVGISLDIPLFDIYGQDDVRWSILAALKYVFPVTAYYYIRDDHSYNQMLSNILSGAVGDESTIQLIMEYLSGNGGQRHIVDQEAFKGACILQEAATSNSIFDDIMRNLISIAADEKQKPLTVSPEESTGLVLFTTNLTKRYADAVTSVYQNLNDETLSNALESRVHIALAELTKDSNVTNTIFLFLNKTSTLSQEGKDLHHAMMKEYFCGCKLCPSYNFHRNIEPQALDYVSYLCYWYAHCLTKDQFEKIATEYFEKHFYANAQMLINAFSALYAPQE